MFVPRQLACLALIASLLLLSGCGRPSGPARYRVYGIVKFQGQPLNNGSISFSREGAMVPDGGASITNGKYEISASPGLSPGSYHVSISASAGSPADPSAPPGEPVPTKQIIPEQYNVKTVLRAEVTAGGKNEVNFDLN